MAMNKTTRLILIIIMIVLATVSHFAISPVISNPENHAATIQYIDDKEDAVKVASGVALGASVAISMIPGDTATPISNKLTDITSYLLVVLCALIFEKYFITIIGLATFGYIIPIALLLAALNMLLRIPFVKSSVIKMIILSLALNMVIPVSVQVSKNLESTYGITLEMEYNDSEILETDIAETETDTASSEEEIVEETESGSTFSNLINKVKNAAKDAKDSVTDTAENIVDTVSTLTSEKIEELKELIDEFTEYCAVMIVTTALVPILVLLFFIWIINTVLTTVVPSGQFRPIDVGDLRREGASALKHGRRKEEHEHHEE